MNEKERVFKQIQGFINTPPLWTNQQNFLFQQYLLPSINFSFEKSSLPSIPPKIPLGKRVEHFFHYLIHFFSEEEILAHNQQVKSGKITIGEFDFLLKNKVSQQITHVELVYKFYVYDPIFQNEKERWIGPNRKDSLIQKLNKLEEKQFPLLQKAETQSLLIEKGINPFKIEQKICFKAFLFLPKHFLKQKIPIINNDCITGYWLHFAEFLSEEYLSQQFYAPEKQDWPVTPHENVEWTSFSEIKEQVILLFQNKKSPLIWMKTSAMQFERFFVVWW